MIRGAIAHMPDSRWCYCVEPGRFLFRLQAGRDDLQSVTIHYRDKYIPVHLLDTRSSAPMKRVAQDDCHDYFEVELSIDVVCLRYYFELTDKNKPNRTTHDRYALWDAETFYRNAYKRAARVASL